MAAPYISATGSTELKQPVRAVAKATAITGWQKRKGILTAKIIEQNILRFYPQVLQHLDD